MSDDQGDADFEASLANLGNSGDTGAPRPGTGDAALAGRIDSLGAGLHEDLLQVRAIASAIAERDLTDDLQAVRSTVEELASRDPNAPVRNDLAALRDMVVSIQASDPAGELRAELEPLRAGIDRIAEQLSDDSAHQRLLQRLGDLEDRLQARADADRSDELLQRLDELATREQVRGLAADLRAHLADAIGGLDGNSLTAEMRQVKDAVEQDSRSIADTLDRLQETLLDVASGEVVGALWDEFRGLRDHLELRGRLDELRTEPEPTAAGERPEQAEVRGDDTVAALDGLHQQLDALRDALERMPTPAPADDTAAREAADGVARTSADIRALSHDLNNAIDEIRALAAAVDELGETATPGTVAPAEVSEGPTLHDLADQLAALRAELADGLVVEPSEDLTSTLEALQGDLDGLRTGLESLPAIREAIDAVQERLDEGLVLADDVELPAAAAASPPTDGADGSGAAVADQIAALRDHLATELDGVRALISQAASPAPNDEPVQAGLDPDTLDLLRDEIRAAGAVPDQVLDALRQELKALRRRLAVKAQERVLSDEQLGAIADAVAERLHQD